MYLQLSLVCSLLQNSSGKLLFCLSAAQLRWEVLSCHHCVHVPAHIEIIHMDCQSNMPAQVVKIFLVQGQQDVGEIVNVRSAGSAANASDDCHEELLPMLVYQWHQGFNFPEVIC